MSDTFSEIQVGQEVKGQPFAVSHQTLRAFAEASIDFNPLHFDEKFMESQFGKTKFKGVIAHGANVARMSAAGSEHITKTGAVAQVEVTGIDKVVANCVAQVLFSIQFPKPKKSSIYVILSV